MKDISHKIEQLLEKTHDNFLKVGAHFAAKGDLVMHEEILRQRPHWLNYRASHGRSMLWEAVNHRKIGCIQYLLEKGASVEAPGCHFSEHLVEISLYVWRCGKLILASNNFSWNMGPGMIYTVLLI